MDRQTKIIATLGPAVASAAAVADLVEAGMDVARLNFSHGDHDAHHRSCDWVRQAEDRHERPVAVLQDIQGPKLRVGRFPTGSVTLVEDDEVALVAGSGEAEPGTVRIDYPHLLDDVAPGDRVLLSDGLIRLEARSTISRGLVGRVVVGGVLRDHQGVAFPDTSLQVSAVTDKDRADLRFGRELGVDVVAASFVRSRSDIEQVRPLVSPGTPIIAKIEHPAAIDHLDEILSASQGAMVARGDLGVELPLERIPLLQHDILRRTNSAGLVSITATEMLESMRTAPRPTRAEVTDVAQAVMAGTDAVMLSGETAAGRHPIEAVRTMSRICREVEHGLDELQGSAHVDFLTSQPTFASATARAAVDAATNLGLDTIAAFTESGNTALLLSKYRPTAEIVAFTPVEATLRRMALFWGVTPTRSPRHESTDLMIAAAEEHLERHGICAEGDGVVMVAGTPPNRRASTNLMKLHHVGEQRSGATASS